MSLYADKTFENIQAEALEDIRNRIEELPENQRVDASEGSFHRLPGASWMLNLPALSPSARGTKWRTWRKHPSRLPVFRLNYTAQQAHNRV